MTTTTNEIAAAAENAHRKREEMKATFTELMHQYDTAREKWLAAHGDDEGFDEWFLGQVTTNR